MTSISYEKQLRLKIKLQKECKFDLLSIRGYCFASRGKWVGCLRLLLLERCCNGGSSCLFVLMKIPSEVVDPLTFALFDTVLNSKIEIAPFASQGVVIQQLSLSFVTMDFLPPSLHNFALSFERFDNIFPTKFYPWQGILHCQLLHSIALQPFLTVRTTFITFLCLQH